MQLLIAFALGFASCFLVLYVLGRRSGRTGPNSRVVTREAVTAILTTPAKRRR